MEQVNFETITVQDCVDMYERKGATTIINDGSVAGFFFGEGEEKAG